MTRKLFFITLILLCNSCIATPVKDSSCAMLVFGEPDETGRVDWKMTDVKNSSSGSLGVIKRGSLLILGENHTPQSANMALDYQTMLSCIVRKSRELYDVEFPSIISSLQVQDLPCRSLQYYLAAIENGKPISSPVLPRGAIDGKDKMVGFLSESGALKEWANAIAENGLSVSAASGRWLEWYQLESVEKFVLSEELKSKAGSSQCGLTGDEHTLLRKNVSDKNVFIFHHKIELILE